MLVDITTASQPFKVEQSIAAAELKKKMGARSSVNRLIDMAARYSGIDSRYIVVPDAAGVTAL